MVKHSPHAPPQTAGGSPLIDRVPRGSIEGLAAAFCGGASAPHFNAAWPSETSPGSGRPQQPMGRPVLLAELAGGCQPSEAQAILSNEKFQAGQSSPLTPPCRQWLLLHWLPVAAWLGQGFGQADLSRQQSPFSKQKQTLSDPHTAHFHPHQSTARVGPRPPSPHTPTQQQSNNLNNNKPSMHRAAAASAAAVLRCRAAAPTSAATWTGAYVCVDRLSGCVGVLGRGKAGFDACSRIV